MTRIMSRYTLFLRHLSAKCSWLKSDIIRGYAKLVAGHGAIRDTSPTTCNGLRSSKLGPESSRFLAHINKTIFSVWPELNANGPRLSATDPRA